MTTVMIIPAGIYQVPAILKAKELGFRVISADYSPDNPGHKYADRSEFISILEKEKLLSLAKEEKIDAIFTMASDIAVKSVAYVSNKMGLKEFMPYENVDKILLKHRFREFQKQNGFTHPVFRAVESYSDFKKSIIEIGLPVMVKPSDASGSKGVFLIDTMKNLTDSLLQDIFTSSLLLSNNKILCVEKFHEGLEIGGDALIAEGKIKFCMLTNKYLTAFPEFIPVGHSIPNGLSNSNSSKIKASLQKTVDLLEIESGSLNFDVLMHNENFFTIELSPRNGGNCIPSIIKYATGIDTIEASILLSLGHNLDDVENYEIKPTGVRILRSDKDGVLKGYRDLGLLKDKYRSVLELEIDIPVGSKVRKYTQGAYRIGHIICSVESVAAVESELDAIEDELNLYFE